MLRGNWITYLIAQNPVTRLRLVRPTKTSSQIFNTNTTAATILLIFDVSHPSIRAVCVFLHPHCTATSFFDFDSSCQSILDLFFVGLPKKYSPQNETYFNWNLINLPLVYNTFLSTTISGCLLNLVVSSRFVFFHHIMHYQTVIIFGLGVSWFEGSNVCVCVGTCLKSIIFVILLYYLKLNAWFASHDILH